MTILKTSHFVMQVLIIAARQSRSLFVLNSINVPATTTPKTNQKEMSNQYAATANTTQKNKPTTWLYLRKKEREFLRLFFIIFQREITCIYIFEEDRIGDRCN